MQEVRKIMTKNPACCTPDSTLQEVAHMMEMYDCGCIPVVNNHQEKRPVGTITDRDITIRTFSANKNPLELKASDVMTTDVETVTPETSVHDCLKLMEEKQIRRVLVVDKSGKCAGIVAQADLAEHVTDSSQTANFVREVSESDSDRSSEKNYKANRSFEGEGRNRQTDHSESQNQSAYKSRVKYGKPKVKKESFFNVTTLLTLLGSISLGAGIKYYLGAESDEKLQSSNKHRIKTGTFNTETTTVKKTTDLSTPKSSSIDVTMPSTVSPTGKTENRETITVTVSSIDNTIDDNDLKPITEIGRTANNI